MTEQETNDLLKRLDEHHRQLAMCWAKPGPTIYSEAAAEIRRLLQPGGGDPVGSGRVSGGALPSPDQLGSA